MNILKLISGLILLTALVIFIQLGDTTGNTPVSQYRALPVGDFVALAQAEARDGQQDRALFLLDYALQQGLPNQTAGTVLRQEYYQQLVASQSAAGRLRAIGWEPEATTDNAYTSLAGGTVADATAHGTITGLAVQGALENPSDPLVTALNASRPMAAVFPPATHAITLAKAAQGSGAINPTLARQLQSILVNIQAAPQSAAAVENFRGNVMPLFELARQCRSWSEFHILLLQADSADQVKVLTRMAAASPSAARKAALVLSVASRSTKVTPSQCLDHVLRLGPDGLEQLHAAAAKAGNGLAFAIAHPAMAPSLLTTEPIDPSSSIEPIQKWYRDLYQRYGAPVTLFKYWMIALLAALMILTFVPGVYLEKLMITPGQSRVGPPPGAVHHLMVALGVGVGVSLLTYVFAMAMSPSTDTTATAAAGQLAGTAAATAAAHSDNALLSGIVVAFSLLAHVVIWFWVRSKLRQVEEDESTEAALRLQRLDNLDMFLDLPLFTGLALTVIAFILITFNAGMSRHFAYTSTVVGILSAVSLRVLFLYPLKERLIHNRWSAES